MLCVCMYLCVFMFCKRTNLCVFLFCVCLLLCSASVCLCVLVCCVCACVYVRVCMYQCAFMYLCVNMYQCVFMFCECMYLVCLRSASVCIRARLRPAAASLSAVQPERHEAEEDGEAHQGGGGSGGEELAVLDLKVPQHRQHEHEEGHHQAAHVERHVDLVGRPRARRHLGRGMLGDVAVQDAVVCQVERGQGLSVVPQQLALVDQPHLVLLSCEISPARGREA